MLDPSCAELRRCRTHCTKWRGAIDHRTPTEHEYDDPPSAHLQQPLGPTTVRSSPGLGARHGVLEFRVLGLGDHVVLRMCLRTPAHSGRCAFAYDEGC